MISTAQEIRDDDLRSMLGQLIPIQRSFTTFIQIVIHPVGEEECLP
jgi:hypothetical protein